MFQGTIYERIAHTVNALSPLAARLASPPLPPRLNVQSKIDRIRLHGHQQRERQQLILVDTVLLLTSPARIAANDG